MWCSVNCRPTSKHADPSTSQAPLGRSGQAARFALIKWLFPRLWVLAIWLFAILFLVPALLFGSLINPIFNGNPVSISNLKLTFDIVPMFIVFFIAAGLGEEIGWAGFILPRLQAQFGALISSLIRATLVVIWHIPLLIYSRIQPYTIPDFPYGDWIVQKGFLLTLAGR